MKRGKIRLFSKLITVRNWNDFEQQVARNFGKHDRPMSGLLFACEDHEASYDYLRDHWDLIDSRSGEVLNLYTVLPKGSQKEIYDHNGNLILPTSSAEKLIEIQKECFDGQQIFKIPSLVLFDQFDDRNVLELSLSSLSDDELHDFFESLFQRLNECLDEYRRSKGSLRYNARDFYFHFIAREKRKKFIEQLKLIPSSLPASLYEGFTLALIRLGSGP